MNHITIEKLQESLISTNESVKLTDTNYRELNEMINQHIFHLYDLKKKLNDHHTRNHITKDLLTIHDLITIHKTPNGLRMIMDELKAKKEIKQSESVISRHDVMDQRDCMKKDIPMNSDVARNNEEVIISDFEFDDLDIDNYEQMIDCQMIRLSNSSFFGFRELDVSRRYMMVLPDD